MRNESFATTSEDAGKRLDVWLTAVLDGLSRSYVERLIEQGNVTVDGKTVKAGYKLKAGSQVEISIPEARPLEVEAEDIPLDVIHEDQDIIVINKPRGMVVHPAAGNYSGTLVNALLKHCGGSLSDINGIIRPGIVHRIDKDTTGVLVIAKNNNAHSVLSRKLKEHDVNRIYTAVAEGVITEDRGRSTRRLEGTRWTEEDGGQYENRQKGRDALQGAGTLQVGHFAGTETWDGQTHQIGCICLI